MFLYAFGTSLSALRFFLTCRARSSFWALLFFFCRTFPTGRGSFANCHLFSTRLCFFGTFVPVLSGYYLDSFFFGRYKGIRPLLGHIREGFSILSTGCTSLLAEPIARTEYPLRFWRGLLRSLERAVAEESRNCGSVQTTGLVFSVGTGILQVPSQDVRVTGLHKRVLQRLLL